MNLIRNNRAYWRIVVPAGILFAVVCQTVSTYCGLGLTFDSNLFLEGAAFFRGDVTEPFESLLIFQSKPPLLSILLYLIPFLGTGPFYTILLISNLLLIALLTNRIIENSLIRSFAFLSIAGFTPLIMVHVYLWTEPIFMTLFLGSLLILVRNEILNSKQLVWLILLSIAMILIRHVSLFIVIGVSLALFLNKKTPMKQVLIYLGASLLVFVLWSFIFAPTGLETRIATLKVPLDRGDYGRINNILFYFDAVSKWFLPNSLNQTVRIVLVAIGLGLALVLYLGNKKSSGYSQIQSLVIIVTTYYVFMHLAFKIYPDSAERYSMPIYPIAVISLSWLANNYLIKNPNRTKLVIGILMIWLLYPFSRSIKNAIFWNEKICSENSISLKHNLDRGSENQLQNVTLQPLGIKDN